MPASSYGDMSGSGLLRRVAPWVALALVSLMVLAIYTTYRRNLAVWETQQRKPLASQTASATPAPKKPKATPAKQQTGGVSKISKVVIVSSVTFRKDPSSSSQALRDLQKGERLTLVGQVGSWYKVTDAQGNVGWVSASDKYTKVEQGQ